MRHYDEKFCHINIIRSKRRREGIWHIFKAFNELDFCCDAGRVAACWCFATGILYISPLFGQLLATLTELFLWPETFNICINEFHKYRYFFRIVPKHWHSFANMNALRWMIGYMKQTPLHHQANLFYQEKSYHKWIKVNIPGLCLFFKIKSLHITYNIQDGHDHASNLLEFVALFLHLSDLEKISHPIHFDSFAGMWCYADSSPRNSNWWGQPGWNDIRACKAAEGD